MDKQRRDENLLNRPIKFAAIAAGVCALLFVVVWIAGLLTAPFAVLGMIACLFVIVITGYALWQGEQALRYRIGEEKARIERIREKAMAELNAAQERHAAAYREWERHRIAYETQKEWYPVSVPEGVDRLDVAGGTLSGWRAMVTMMGAARLDAGSEISVLDLTEGAVAGDLVTLARSRGENPLVWVLPSDLPRLDLTASLGAEALADVLSLVVSVSEDQGTTKDVSFDNAILERVLTVFGGQAKIAQITAALRALAQVGDPREDMRLGLLDESQLEKITMMFGRGVADRVVIERAWALESQLRKLETLGTERVDLPSSRLKVVSMDRSAGVFTNRVLGTYVVTALTHLLRAAPPQRPWGHTLFICGADKLRGDVIDRLVDACETTYTGLVLMYRAVPQHVRERLGRGNAAVGFMRLGNAEDARVASEHVGTGRRFEIARLTHGLSREVADLTGTRYASTIGPAEVHLPASAESDSFTEGIGSTDWGRTTRAAAGGAASGAGAATGPREFQVEQQQLQELPPTAMIFTHPTTNGPRVLLVDANPGILTLPVGGSERPGLGSDRPGVARPEPDPADGGVPRTGGVVAARPPGPGTAGTGRPGRFGQRAPLATTRPANTTVRPVPAAEAPGPSNSEAARPAASAAPEPGPTAAPDGIPAPASAGPGTPTAPGAATPRSGTPRAGKPASARPPEPDRGREPLGRPRPPGRPTGDQGSPKPGRPVSGDPPGPRPGVPARSSTPTRTGAAMRTGTPPPLGLDPPAGVRARRGPAPAAPPAPRPATSPEPARAEPDPEVSDRPGALEDQEVQTFVRPGDEPAPNLGPPKPRLDFRRDR